MTYPRRPRAKAAAKAHARPKRTLAEAERECAHYRVALESANEDARALREVLATFGTLAEKLATKADRSATRRAVILALRDLADEWAPAP